MAFKEGVVIGTVILNPSGSANTSINTGTSTGTLSIGNTNSGLVTINSGTAGLTLGTTANAHATTFGGTNSTSSTTVQSGTGGISVTSSNGTMTVNSGTGTLSIASDATNDAVNIATGAGVKDLTIGSTNTTSAVNIYPGGSLFAPSLTEGAVVSDSAGLISTENDADTTYVLTSNGVGSVPTFQAPPSVSPGLMFIATRTASNSASLVFDNTEITSTHYNYMIVFNNLSSSSSTANYLRMVVSDDNGSSYQTTAYASSATGVTFGGSTLLITSITDGIILNYSTGTAGPIDYLNGYAYLNDFAVSTSTATVSFETTHRLFSGFTRISFGGGYYGGVAFTTNNIKFEFDTGNIAAGSISLYGFAKS